MGRILIVDDEAGVLASMKKMLAACDHEVATARSAEDGMELLARWNPDIVIMDVRLPAMSGLDAFRRIRVEYPRLPVIIMTGFGTMDSAVEATKLGAFEYVIKPFRAPDLLRIVDQALDGVRLMRGHVSFAPTPGESEGDVIVGATPVMQELYKAIGRVARADATVLVRGETGTGKELVARAIYQHSRRAAAPLFLVNCAAVPETLLETEFFGHERGAFTGAAARRIGKLEQANGGTVLLDEIGEVPITIQAKLLRVLQERRFERVGGNESIQADIRIIAATNRNLEQAIAEGRFRQDLYHRLNVVTILVPALRDRREDIPLLAGHFLARFARELQVDPPAVTPEAMDVLSGHDWPGNVRELEHCIQRVIIFTHGYPVQAEDVRRALEVRAAESPPAPDAGRPPSGGPDDPLLGCIREHLASYAGEALHRAFLDRVDRLLVMEALRRTHGNQTRAAKLLGLTRPTLQARMQRYGIRRETSVRDD